MARTATAALLGLALVGGETPAQERAPAPNWARVFPADLAPLEIRLRLRVEDWDRLPERPFAYREAAFTGGGVTLARIGVRMKGNSSAGGPGAKRSLKLDFDRFDAAARFHGVAKLNLHNGFKDPTLLREFLAYELFRAAGVPAPRVGFARLTVDFAGDGRRAPLELGLYTVVQQVDGDFLREHFADASGNLWKLEGGADFSWRGGDPADYGGWELKRNERRGDYGRLLGFLRTLHATPDADVALTLARALDVERCLRFLACHVLLTNLDSPIGTGHNGYCYHEPSQDRFALAPWDLNEAFGNFRMGSAEDAEQLSVREPCAGQKPLFDRLLRVPAWRDRYLDIVRELCQGPFSEAAMGRAIDRARDAVAAVVRADPTARFPYDEWRRAIEDDVRQPRPGPGGRSETVSGLKAFVRRRLASVAAQLDGESEGRRPAGRAFPGPPAGGGCVPAALAMGPHQIRVTAEGRIERVEVATGRVVAAAVLPGADEPRPAGAPEPPKPPADDGRHVEELFRRADRDSDGRISPAEFPGPPEHFKHLDADRDGRLDRDEVARAGPPPGGPGSPGGPGGPRGPRRPRVRELALAASTHRLAVVATDTLYVYDLATLRHAGHNRFGEPPNVGLGRPPKPRGGRPAALADGDRLWVVADGRLIRFDLADLEAKAEADGPLPEGPGGTLALDGAHLVLTAAGRSCRFDARTLAPLAASR